MNDREYEAKICDDPPDTYTISHWEENLLLVAMWFGGFLVGLGLGIAISIMWR